MEVQQKDRLRDIYADKEMSDQLRNSLINFARGRAADKSVAREEFSGADVVETIKMFFQLLEQTYAPKKEKKVEDPE